MTSIKMGDKVRYFSPDGVHTGIVLSVEVRYGCHYASIKPDGSKNICYLFHGAIVGFEKLDEQPHSWSPLMMARYRMMKLT